MKTLSNETTTQKRERSLSQHHEIKKEVESVMSDHQELIIFKRLSTSPTLRTAPPLPSPSLPLYSYFLLTE